MSRNSRNNRGKAPKPVPYSNTYGSTSNGSYSLDQYRTNSARDRKALAENMYFRILSELSANRFKWTGLPPTVDARFLELTLYRSALSVFFKHDKFGFLALPASGSGDFNMYNTPTSYTVTGNRFVSQKVLAKDCVPIWANALRIPETDTVLLYATRLAELDMTIEINARQMRRTYVVFAEENQRLSYENIMRQHDEGTPAIFGTQYLDLAKIQVFPSAPNENAVLNLQVAKSKVWNECMTMLGINNANQDKRERLVAAEVGANDEQVDSTRDVSLRARQEAARRINQRFDLSVSVDWAGDFDNGMDYLGQESSTTTIGMAQDG